MMHASSAEIREWARANNLPVGARGRLRPEIVRAYYDAHSSHEPTPAA